MSAYDWSNDLEKSIQDLNIEKFKYEQFTKVRELGKGAFGVVHRAVDKYKNDVAIKSIQINDKKVMDAFINE
ncbi:16067_t:CDS:1, partial [Acaulospora colombiana]